MCKLCSISIHVDMNLYADMCMCVLSCFSRVRLFVTLWTVPAGSSVHRIFQVRILEWVAMPFSRGSSWPKDRTCICSLGGLKLGLVTSNVVFDKKYFYGDKREKKNVNGCSKVEIQCLSPESCQARIFLSVWFKTSADRLIASTDS